MILGLVGFVLYLWFFVGFEGLFNVLSSLNFYESSMFFSLAVAAFLLSVFFDSLIWHSLLKSLSIKIKLRRIVLYNWIGNFVEMIIPSGTMGGEIARIVLTHKETKNNTGIAAATVIGSRIISAFVYSGGLLIGLLSLIITHQLPLYLLTPIILVSFGTALAIGVVLYVGLKESTSEKLVNLLMRLAKIFVKNPLKLQHQKEKLQHILQSFSEVFRTFKANPRYLVKPVIFAIIAWLFSLIVYLMVFYSLNFPGIALIDLATVYCVSTTVETLTAGFPVGAVELTMINLFSLYGVPLAVAGAATTLSRLLTFWCQLLVGYPLIQWLGAKSLIKGTGK